MPVARPVGLHHSRVHAGRAANKNAMNAVHLNIIPAHGAAPGLDAGAPHFRALSLALAARDAHTGHHSERTQLLAHALGQHCGLGARELRELHVAAVMHDIGKLAVPDRLLLKPGVFDAHEREEIQSHAEHGAGLLLDLHLEGIVPVAEAVLHHHEAWDGSGYPHRLAGEAIPVLSRIISVADTYDAIASVRPYHPATPHHRVMQMLHEEAGAKLDPYLVGCFAQVIEGSALKVA